jgi:hypothetical protein
VAAAGPPPLSYQWRKDGVNLADDGRISGATTPNLLIQPARLPDSGAYDVVVSNNWGSITSQPASLTVLGITGDLNCDGLVNAFDIDPFIIALTMPSHYGRYYPDCNWMLADCNGDGFVDAFDIDPFIACLTTGCP